MREFCRKIFKLHRRDELAARLHEELEFHQSMQSAEGRKTDVLGNRTRILEQADDVWSLGRLEQMVFDLRLAVRSLTRSPAFFALAAVGTGLGVSAITAVLSVADSALVRSLPYRDPSRLVVVSDQLLKLNFSRFPISIANFVDYRAQNRVFEDMAAFEPRALTVTGGDHAERVAGMMASANLLSLLGVSTASGRWFDPAENHRGHNNVAVLSDSFARSHPGASLRMNDEVYQVVGVLKPGFAFRLSGEAPDVWLPALLDPAARDAGNLRAIARLKAGVTLASAQAQMHVIAADLKRRYHAGMGPHGEDGGYDAVVIPLREELYGAVRPTLYALAAASTILLLLGLANTALLWTGRATARRKETAVRLALGASRLRAAQELVMEALLPSLAGGLLALLLTQGALAVLNRAIPEELAAVDGFALDYRVFAFALLLSALAGVVFGVVPVRSVFRSGEGGWMADRTGIAPRSEGRMRQLMVAIQVSFVCALLAPALLLMQSLSALEKIDPGVRTRNLITGYVSVPAAHAPDPAAWYRRVEEVLHRQFGNRVTLASALPLSQGAGGDPFSIEGRAFGASGSLPQFAHILRVGDGYFDLMRIRILTGRAFQPRDFAEPTHVAIVNETLSKAFWPGEPPLGKRVLMGAPRPGAAWITIFGTAADIHTSRLTDGPLPQIYFPYSQWPTRTMAIVAETSRAADLTSAVRAADPDVPLFSVRSMEERVAQAVEQPRLRTRLFATYSALAFAMAGFGVYSMAVYSALRRRREFAVRVALGATRGRLIAALVGGTVVPAAAGGLAGLAGGYGIAHALAGFLYGAKPWEPGVYLLTVLAAIAVTAAATVFGGRKPLNVAPAELLRGE